MYINLLKFSAWYWLKKWQQESIEITFYGTHTNPSTRCCIRLYISSNLRNLRGVSRIVMQNIEALILWHMVNWPCMVFFLVFLNACYKWWRHAAMRPCHIDGLVQAAVTPLLMNWSYCSLAIIHRYMIQGLWMKWASLTRHGANLSQVHRTVVAQPSHERCTATDYKVCMDVMARY